MSARRGSRLSALGAVLGVVASAACHHHTQDTRPDAAAAVVAATLPPAPQACTTALPVQAPVLKLPRTDVPKLASKDSKVDIAQIHTVNRPLQEIGVWSEAGDGWSVLSLQFGSERARSLAVRLHGVKLPKGAALWLCSVDGKLRAGPFAPKDDGELWSDAISAPQARLEVWAPSAQRDQVSGLLADIYGGYR
ncbi:hypothetical protein [Solimonas soli]|uniref:hypothetical protein n=1 Tax=Solimonas soli TaxID=413479 RepID=UPI000481195A|nr:hypothetical protein [Solimonas soli]